MRLYRVLPMVLLAGAVALGACGDENDPTGPRIEAFAGTWTATNLTYTSQADPNKRFEAHKFGFGLSGTISATGELLGQFVTPQGNIPITGSFTLVGSNQIDVDLEWPTPEMQANPPITDFVGTYTLQGNTLTITRPQTMFAFPPSTTAEASTLVMVLTRTSTST